MMLFGRCRHIHISLTSIMHFISLLRASLVVIVVIASMVCSSDAATQYVNGSTIFGSCFDFSIQAGTAVSFNGAQTTVATGNVGVAPGTSITGNVALGTGSIQDNTAAASNCAADELIAYGELKNLTCTAANTLASPDLNGLTLFPGVYCSGSGFFTFTATTLTLDGNGDTDSQFIFQTSTSLTTSTATFFILQNGAQAKNVYWQIGSSASLALSSSFVGHILAGVSITVDTTTSIVGRCLAQAAVSFAGGDTVTLPAY
jgi:hypothetical protein